MDLSERAGLPGRYGGGGGMRRPPLAVMAVVWGRKSSPPIVFWIEMAGAEREDDIVEVNNARTRVSSVHCVYTIAEHSSLWAGSSYRDNKWQLEAQSSTLRHRWLPHHRLSYRRGLLMHRWTGAQQMTAGS